MNHFSLPSAFQRMFPRCTQWVSSKDKQLREQIVFSYPQPEWVLEPRHWNSVPYMVKREAGAGAEEDARHGSTFLRNTHAVLKKQDPPWFPCYAERELWSSEKEASVPGICHREQFIFAGFSDIGWLNAVTVQVSASMGSELRSDSYSPQT